MSFWINNTIIAYKGIIEKLDPSLHTFGQQLVSSVHILMNKIGIVLCDAI